MFNILTHEMEYILANALKAGTLGVVITTFALPDRARQRIAPFLLFIGSIASIFLLTSAILSSIQFFKYIAWASNASIICFCIGTFTLPIPVIYIVYKILRMRILIGD